MTRPTPPQRALVARYLRAKAEKRRAIAQGIAKLGGGEEYETLAAYHEDRALAFEAVAGWLEGSGGQKQRAV